MNQPSQFSGQSRLKQSARRRRRGLNPNSTGISQLFLGHKVMGELRILARLASTKSPFKKTPED